jgi:hypothetical protein
MKMERVLAVFISGLFPVYFRRFLKTVILCSPWLGGNCQFSKTPRFAHISAQPR